MNNREETLIPKLGVITDVRIDTPDIKTFRVVTPDGKKAFDHRPGQCAMLSIPGVGEAMFSITSSPTTTRTESTRQYPFRCSKYAATLRKTWSISAGSLATITLMREWMKSIVRYTVS